MGKTKTKSRRRSAATRPVQAPKTRELPRRLPARVYALGGTLLLALFAGGALLLAREQAESGSKGPAAAAGGLPNTSDYHSLLVGRSDPQHLMLGTHAGLYESLDGGRSWKQVALAGQDAMNLARSVGETAWAAGHNVLARSDDGGESWSDVRPDGLPSLDVHSFAVDPRDQALWAAVAGEGLYHSIDDGVSFVLVTEEVGGNVMALAVTPEGRLLAGDMQRGLLVSENEGKAWRAAERAPVMGLAINPDDPAVVIAAGPRILRSSDADAGWEQVHAIAEGAGPAAWSESDPDIGYVVRFDRTLYRTDDHGRSWQPVS